MLKLLSLCLTGVQFILFIGIVVIIRLSQQHMTVMRIVLYKNRVWAGALPLANLLAYAQAALAVLALLAFLILLVQRFTNHQLAKFSPGQLTILAVLAGSSAAFISWGNIESLPTFYIIVVLLCSASFLQLLKTVISAKRKSA